MIVIMTWILASVTAWSAINCEHDTRDRFPSVVKIIRQTQDGDRQCTGTLLKGGCFVLTAGHCLKDRTGPAGPGKFIIRGGPNSEKKLPDVAEVHLHPEFQEFKKNDIGLLKLKTCVEGGLDLNFTPMDLKKDVVVGGYGVQLLNSFTSQPTRRMGTNKIVSFDDEKICLGRYLVAEDGLKIIEGRGCLPVGQDSGSALMQEGSIRGVFVETTERWLSDGKTEVRSSCFTSLRHPAVMKFLNDVLKPTSSSTVQDLPAAETQK